MRTTRRNRPPQVEALESMMLLSAGVEMPTATAPTPVDVMATTGLPIPEIVALNGKAAGSYTSSKKIPDAGTTYTLEGVSGTFAGHGKGVVAGTLHTPGFILNGKATGTFKVSLPGGTVTLALTSSPQNSFSNLPSKFSYVITAGTGKFHNAVGDPVGHGTVDVTHKSAHGLVLFNAHGKIALSFHAMPVALA